MKTKQLAQIGIIAALYAVLTITIAPISFGFIQLRISSFLKCLFLKDRKYICGVVIGVIAANVFSPYDGAWELGFMPLVTILAAELTYRLRDKPIIALAVNAVVTAAGVALMLQVVAGVPFWITQLSVTISEAIIMILGQKVFMRYLDAAISKWSNKGN